LTSWFNVRCDDPKSAPRSDTKRNLGEPSDQTASGYTRNVKISHLKSSSSNYIHPKKQVWAQTQNLKKSSFCYQNQKFRKLDRSCLWKLSHVEGPAVGRLLGVILGYPGGLSWGVLLYPGGMREGILWVSWVSWVSCGKSLRHSLRRFLKAVSGVAGEPPSS
jgi:hypothetical protein